MNVTQDLSILTLIWNASEAFEQGGTPPCIAPTPEGNAEGRRA